MDLLNSFSFDTAGKKIFSAGQVLCAHRLLTEVKDELVPALQAVAEFDAYCSLAAALQRITRQRKLYLHLPSL